MPLLTNGWILTRAALWFADLVIVFLIVVPLLAPTSHEPLGWRAPTFQGIPQGLVLHVVGVGLAIGGRLWMERILRAGREPEAHDEFWWSRT
ncbi:MAG: hypothetical protein L0227_08150 [Chloroflexi bacterium]|nr:hypothetical protein [Chloroflexota bacterium]